MSSSRAEGQIAGYLYQLERAVYWLSKIDAGSIVGVETIDDVGIRGSDGSEIREQDKSSIGTRNPYSDKSLDLWKSIYNWLGEIKAGNVDRQKSRFLLVTTHVVPSSAIAWSISNATTASEITQCIQRFRELGKDPSATNKAIVNAVLAYSDSDLECLFGNITLIDGTQNSTGTGLKDEIASLLHFPPSFPRDEVLASLLGWVFSQSIEKIRRGEMAWIKRVHFDIQLHRVFERFRSEAFLERAKRLIEISREEITSQVARKFVTQIALVTNDPDFQHEAISDYLRCLSERSRLITEGFLTVADMTGFDDRLLERWQGIFRTRCRMLEKEAIGEEADAKAGLEILEKTLEHREMLAGRQTVEYYLTKGSYHMLSDEEEVGWHPKFKGLVNLIKKSTNED